MKGIIASPNIAPFIRESVLAYEEAGMLDNFCTTVYFHPDKKTHAILSANSKKLEAELKRRRLDQLSIKHIKSLLFPELLRIGASRYSNALLADKIWEWAEKYFDRWVSKKIRQHTSFIHVYEHAALTSLKVSKARNILSIYEQPSQHHHYFTEVVAEQLKQYPELGSDEIALLHNEKAERRNLRRDEELDLAAYILCNSSFTRKTLIKAGIAENKILTIPYGFPETFYIKIEKGKKIRFLYAGNMSLRKGIHLLLQSWKALNTQNAELYLVGKNQLPDFFWQDLPENIIRVNNLPQEEYFKVLAGADIFVMPTLADGFGMVISEAMAMGIPVLTTTASAGPDIIKHEEDGLLIPSNDIEALKSMIEWCMNNKEQLHLMGAKAIEKAKIYPWSAYRKSLSDTVSKLVIKH